LEEASKNRTYHGIQALRGIAACLVVLVHGTHVWLGDFSTGQMSLEWANGKAGVDIFFVISGFVITLSAIGDKALTASQFLGRRLLRIVPLYWLLTFVASLKMFLVWAHPSFGSRGYHSPLPIGYLLQCLFFIPVKNPYGHISPLLDVGWTLNYEMFFYLLFTVALALRIKPVHFLTPVLAALATVGLFQRASWPAATTLADPLLLEFLAGMLLGWWVQRGFTLNFKAAPILGLLGIAGVLALPEGNFPGSRVLMWGIPGFLLVLAAVSGEVRWGQLVPQWMMKIGDASYSLYLIHQMWILFLGRLYLRSHLPAPGKGLFALLALVTSVPVSLALYRFVERPMGAAIKSWSKSGLTRPPRAGVPGVKPAG
jgi:peptidoglycan/LPS O-acetylase OafA/YrhL